MRYDSKKRVSCSKCKGVFGLGQVQRKSDVKHPVLFVTEQVATVEEAFEHAVCFSCTSDHACSLLEVLQRFEAEQTEELFQSLRRRRKKKIWRLLEDLRINKRVVSVLRISCVQKQPMGVESIEVVREGVGTMSTSSLNAAPIRCLGSRVFVKVRNESHAPFVIGSEIEMQLRVDAFGVKHWVYVSGHEERLFTPDGFETWRELERRVQNHALRNKLFERDFAASLGVMDDLSL